MIFENLDNSVKTKIFTGYNALRNNTSPLKELGSKCLIVTGKHSAKVSGALADAEYALNKEEIKYDIFDEICENPTLEICYQAGYLAFKEKYDFIMAIGGGSAIDASKTAAIFATNPNIEPFDIFRAKVWNTSPLPVVAVGTTAGTGTEVSRAAVITLETTNRKLSVSDEDCLPSISYCDPKYTYTAGRDLTVSTALDALSHITEGWFNKNCDEIARESAKRGLPAVISFLKKLKNGDEINNEDRDNMYYASLYAGTVLKLGTTYPHGIGYILTENYGVPHGQACAVFLPHLIKWSKKYAPEEVYKSFFEVMGTDEEEFLSLLDALINLPEIQMSKKDIEKYSVRWYGGVPKFQKVYGNFTRDNAQHLLEELFGE